MVDIMIDCIRSIFFHFRYLCVLVLLVAGCSSDQETIPRTPTTTIDLNPASVIGGGITGRPEVGDDGGLFRDLRIIEEFRGQGNTAPGDALGGISARQTEYRSQTSLDTVGAAYAYARTTGMIDSLAAFQELQATPAVAVRDMPSLGAGVHIHYFTSRATAGRRLFDPTHPEFSTFRQGRFNATRFSFLLSDGSTSMADVRNCAAETCTLAEYEAAATASLASGESLASSPFFNVIARYNQDGDSNIFWVDDVVGLSAESSESMGVLALLNGLRDGLGGVGNTHGIAPDARLSVLNMAQSGGRYDVASLQRSVLESFHRSDKANVFLFDNTLTANVPTMLD